MMRRQRGVSAPPHRENFMLGTPGRSGQGVAGRAVARGAAGSLTFACSNLECDGFQESSVVLITPARKTLT
jgi:hypothetical protein